MLTNEIRNQIDQIWNAFWSGGISNPLEVIEQITYLLFIKRLDELQTLEELKASRLKAPIERRLFPEGEDDHPRSPRPYADYRWSRFKHFAPADMYEVVGEHEHGSMDARLLYDSPYTDFSPRGVDGVFQSKEVDELVSILDEVRRRAVG